MNKYSRLYNTLKYLKPIQFYYRFFYLFKAKIRKSAGLQYPLSEESKSFPLKLSPSISAYQSYMDNKFTFLNLYQKFDTTIDWNYSGHGKLWTYNLTYFDFLHQNGISKDDGIKLIHDFIDQSNTLKDALEPFPISLRGINWIKFITAHDIKDQTIDSSLFAQYSILLDNLEYHLLGNHLLENGFSLLFGAYYFRDKILYESAKKILTHELAEQILPDGAHFELSPMYHQIMLYRILDCINLLQQNTWKEEKILPLLESKAETMLGWLETVTFSDGTIPLLNDSANGIAPTTKELVDYAKTLGIHAKQTLLTASGYRKIVKDDYECMIDVGHIGPDYIPGHAHSDTFNFELYIAQKPIIVDTGLSTYETNERRTLERATASHNTVEIDKKEQSEVWGGFRVAKRAKIISLHEDIDEIEATHNGYEKIGALHTRKFSFENRRITIHDTVQSKAQPSCMAFLHFHPGMSVITDHDSAQVESYRITFAGHHKIETDTYQYAPEFNKLLPATVLKISFTEHLKMEIAL